jgi:hypothetical protein
MGFLQSLVVGWRLPWLEEGILTSAVDDYGQPLALLLLAAKMNIFEEICVQPV